MRTLVSLTVRAGPFFNEAAGMTPPDVIEADGKLRRFSSNGKPKDDAGWYVLHGGAIPTGVMGNHRTGLHENWRADIGRTLTPSEEVAHRAKMEAMKMIRQGEEDRRRANAAKKAAAIWDAAAAVGAGSPYLARKQVAAVATLREIDVETAAAVLGYMPKARGEPLAGLVLVAPVKIGDTLSTCELIDGDGRKSAIYGGAKAGGYWAAQALPDNDGDGLTLFIGEAVATALSVREACGQPSIASLSAGNLGAVAKAMRKRFRQRSSWW
jgi:putative DNA primase/helicase